MHSSLMPAVFALLTCLAQAAQIPATPLSPAVSERPILERVFVAGASVSDGFGLAKELKTSVKLAQVFEATCRAEGAHFLPLGDARFFLNPRSAGKRIVTAAVEGEASCFIGLDFLFWSAYGNKSESRRVSDVDAALAELTRVHCPILLGDLPDMTLSLAGSYFGRAMLTPKMIPKTQTLVTINQHLKEWAAARKNTHIVPMATLLAQIQAGEVIRVRTARYEPKDLRELLQADLLHLTAEGSIALCLLAADLLIQNYEGVQASDFVFDREHTMQRLQAIAARLREAEERARQESREERRAKRAERRQREDPKEAGLRFKRAG